VSAVGDSTTMKIVKGGAALGAAMEIGHVAVVVAEKAAILALPIIVANPVIVAGGLATGVVIGQIINGGCVLQ